MEHHREQSPVYLRKGESGYGENVLEHEPGIALFVPDEEPLKFYRAIAEYASSALKSGGALYFEINPIYEKRQGKCWKDWVLKLLIQRKMPSESRE